MSLDDNMAHQHPCACCALLVDCKVKNQELQAFIAKREWGMEQDLTWFREQYRDSFKRNRLKEIEELKATAASQKANLTSQIEDLKKDLKEKTCQLNEAQKQLKLAQDDNVCAKLRRDLRMAEVREKDSTQARISDSTQARISEHRGFEEQLRRAQEDLTAKDEEILALHKAKNEFLCRLTDEGEGPVHAKPTKIKDLCPMEHTQVEGHEAELTCVIGLARKQETRLNAAQRSVEQELRQKQLQLEVRDLQLQTLTEANEFMMQNVTQLTEDVTRLHREMQQFVKEPTTSECGTESRPQTVEQSHRETIPEVEVSAQDLCEQRRLTADSSQATTNVRMPFQVIEEEKQRRKEKSICNVLCCFRQSHLETMSEEEASAQNLRKKKGQLIRTGAFKQAKTADSSQKTTDVRMPFQVTEEKKQRKGLGCFSWIWRRK
uniref:Uncharacterized protein n=1 Tax=Knipowitschia caucasica TaxID=637954 RepID=A0AAV2KE52_KNICA